MSPEFRSIYDLLRHFGDPAEHEWRRRAACRGMNPSVFFSEYDERNHEKAKAVCARCEVKRECLEYAVVNAERYGVWGGTGDRTRRAIRKHLKIEAA